MHCILRVGWNNLISQKFLKILTSFFIFGQKNSEFGQNIFSSVVKTAFHLSKTNNLNEKFSKSFYIFTLCKEFSADLSDSILRVQRNISVVGKENVNMFTLNWQITGEKILQSKGMFLLS